MKMKLFKNLKFEFNSHTSQKLFVIAALIMTMITELMNGDIFMPISNVFVIVLWIWVYDSVQKVDWSDPEDYGTKMRLKFEFLDKHLCALLLLIYIPSVGSAWPLIIGFIGYLFYELYWSKLIKLNSRLRDWIRK